MNDDPYTRKLMEAADSGPLGGEGRFDGLRAEATAAVSHSANALRVVRESYREAYAEVLARWQGLRERIDVVEWPPEDQDAAGERSRTEVDRLTDEIGTRQAELAKLDLAQQTLERTWLFLERGDVTLVSDPSGPPTTGDIAMRIIEAQEAERARLAQEIHDGPAQALTNAIFQVDYIERVLATDPTQAETELRFLRELLRRELGDVRAFISQLRPPLLDELGLSGAILDTVEHLRAMTGLTITTELTAPDAALSDGAQTVALRVAQEALQNVRKHASATTVGVSTTMDDDSAWVLEVRDDGRGFELGAVAARGRRNFGLQFMRERAELVGARLDVRSEPDGGTVVRLMIPTDATREQEESR